MNAISNLGLTFNINELSPSILVIVYTLGATAILGLKNSIAMSTPTFGTTIRICDVNIGRHHNTENYAIVVSV